MASVEPGYERVLTADALAFVADLHLRFNLTRVTLTHILPIGVKRDRAAVDRIDYRHDMSSSLNQPISQDVVSRTAQSLGELALTLGIDPTALEATVARFNAFATQGKDPDYRRGESAFDQITGGDNTRVDLANVCLAPICEPQFYGAPFWPGVLGASGGLHVNTNAQVLNVWEKAITGLYAVGNTAGTPLAGGDPGGGTLTADLTFTYIAAEYLANAGQ